jgi:hypothetical protein
MSRRPNLSNLEWRIAAERAGVDLLAGEWSQPIRSETNSTPGAPGACRGPFALCDHWA